ncbi:Uma2 family endonuclease [Kineococcus glutinatus]|uniref:Putative restriction endonuclease domain-containing protein n=1 Tax=Kineococcus glutinatus TaxID=1070872 RepID=A0ABP9IC11_9ACTN
MSWEDYLARGEYGEYIDGSFYPRMVTGEHQDVVQALYVLLAGTGHRVFATWGWRPTSARRKHEPDLMVIDREHAGRVDRRSQYWDGPVALLVEVLSPSNESKDWVRNMRDYAALGCPEYWIVSPWGRAVHVFGLVDGAYELDEVITGVRELPRWGLAVDTDVLL